MAKPSKLPAWDTTEVNSVEPDTTHQDEGWLAPGGIPEKPPFQTFNHWMNAVWKWIKEFNRQGIVEWDGITVYEIDDITKGSDGLLYSSLVGTNTNNNPVGDVVNWKSTTIDRVPKTGVQDTEDWDGASYVDPDAVGANPVAKIYPDGTIVGSTDNGSYTKYPNGDLICEDTKLAQATPSAAGNVFFSTVVVSYPLAFVGSFPEIGVSSNAAASGFNWAGHSSEGLGGLNGTIFGTAAAGSGTFTYIAKGKWK